MVNARFAALLVLVPACTCDHGEPPATLRYDVRLATEAERTGAAREAMSEAACKAACAAAGAVSCERMHAVCGYDDGHDDHGKYVFVGGLCIGCYPAISAACYRTSTGQRMCVRDCAAGQSATTEVPSPDSTGE